MVIPWEKVISFPNLVDSKSKDWIMEFTISMLIPEFSFKSRLSGWEGLKAFCY